MLVEVAIVCMTNDFPVLGCPTHRGRNRSSYSSVVYQADVILLASLHRYAKNVYHTACVLYKSRCILSYHSFILSLESSAV
jgi:hypothetical protein